MSLLTKKGSQFTENSCPLSDPIAMFTKANSELLIGQSAGISSNKYA